MKWLVVGALVAVFAASLVVQAGRAPATPTPVHPLFRAGQRWAFVPRPGEESATAIVCRVETIPGHGPVVHIRVEGVRLPDPNVPGGFFDSIGHLPLTAEAFEASITRLVAESVPVPPFEEGYARWRAGFDAGRWGLFTSSVAAAIHATEASRQGTAPPPAPR